MSAEFLWTVPVRGDGRRARHDEWNRGDWHPGLPTSPAWVRDDRRGRSDPFEHILSVVKAAEHSGFDGLLVPYDTEGEESIIVASVAARATRWVRTVVEFSPSVTTPVYAAKFTATLQRVARGRLDWKIAVELDEAAAASVGDHVVGTDRFERAGEFLTIARAVWREQGFDFDGRYYAVDSGGLGEPLNMHEFPRVVLDGASPDALSFGAEHADIQLLDAADDGALDASLAELQRLARTAGRQVRAGLALPVIAREDESEAIDRAARLLEERGSGRRADLADLRLAAGLSTGFDRLGFASPVGLLGSYEQVEAAIDAYQRRGLEVFVLDGFPHTEEAYRIGQLLLPRLAALAAAVA